MNTLLPRTVLRVSAGAIKTTRNIYSSNICEPCHQQDFAF